MSFIKKLILFFFLIFSHSLTSQTLQSESSAYQLPKVFDGISDPKNNWFSLVNTDGISVLNQMPFTLSDLPICFKLENFDNSKFSEDLSRALNSALEVWNSSAQMELQKALFRKCSDKEPAKIVFHLDLVGGAKGDGQIKFAEVFLLKTLTPKIAVVLRENELLDFEMTIDQLIEKSLTSKAPPTPDVLNKFRLYKKSKIQTMINQILCHEIGHTVGLGHNFNSQEVSIMDYSERSLLSDYDKDALRAVFNISVQKKWKAINKIQK